MALSKASDTFKNVKPDSVTVGSYTLGHIRGIIEGALIATDKYSGSVIMPIALEQDEYKALRFRVCSLMEDLPVAFLIAVLNSSFVDDKELLKMISHW